MRRIELILLLTFLFPLGGCSLRNAENSKGSIRSQVEYSLKSLILKQAEWAMQQQPVTVTAESSPRSAGGIHDFYSEGDYWWPNVKDPSGPYVQKDGLTNPDNFTAHRLAMIRFGSVIGALASAYKLTGDEKYVYQALKHLRAWFIDQGTMMNSNLQYAQAIKGVTTGRGIGIIDTVHLIEVAQGVMSMKDSPAMEPLIYKGVQDWFKEYISWLRNSKNGRDEMAAKNNHGVCWVMQVASFAKLCNDTSVMEACRQRYKTVLLPDQMAADGSFPLELARTKPYGYSIFNLDAMAVICQTLSNKEDNLWDYVNKDGKSIKKGIEYLYPFVKDKNAWTYKQDVMYWQNWPVAQPFLVFGANAFNVQEWMDTWIRLDHEPVEAEVVRNLPVRHPLIWL